METSPRLLVLLADGDEPQRRALADALDRHGFTAIEAGTGADCLRAAAANTVEFVLLSDRLPDLPVADLLIRLRRISPGAHLTVASASASVDERIEWFAAGADDVVARPCSIPELVARLEAARRRRPSSPSVVLRIADLVIDLRARLVWRCGAEVDLTRREFDLLSHLVRHRGETFSRADLLEVVWSSSADWQSLATVTEHVRRLRSKLERHPSTPEMILTAPGVGYRFADDRDRALRAPVIAELGETGDAMLVAVGTTIAVATPALAALVGGADPGQLVGRDVLEFVAPESLEEIASRQRAIGAGQWPPPSVVTLLRLDGSPVEAVISVTPVSHEGGIAGQATVWPLGAANDLRRQMTGIATEVPDAIVISTVGGVIESFNSAAEQLFGWREAEVIGREILEVIPWLGPGEALTAAWRELQATGRWHGIARHRHRDGSTVEVASTTAITRNAAGEPIGIIAVSRPRATAEASIEHAHASADAADLRRGLAAGELVVYYQPQVDLRSGAVVGVEALARWHHPIQGLLEPSAFIGCAEESGAIVELGDHVLDAACRQAEQWRRAGTPLEVSVNLSTRQLADATIVDRVRSAMERTAMPPGGLWLEVTETALVEDLDHAADTLLQLEALGARIAIDDFGTGWASMTYLHAFPVHALKIDSMFTRGLTRSANDVAIVRSLLSLGAELGLTTVAEGVETADELDMLRKLGCNLAQGYLLGRPVPAASIVARRRTGGASQPRPVPQAAAASANAAALSR